jgi:rare lipoprotein A
LAGRHKRAGSSGRSVPVLAAVAVAVLLVGAAVAAINLGPAKQTAVEAESSTNASRTPSPAPQPSQTRERHASRGELRAVPTSPSAPSRSPSAARSTSCQASYYGTGTTTASGEKFDPNAYTAAHKTLPFNTRVRVTNPSNGKSVVVRINDRGPFVAGRCLDLTPVAFQVIASLGSGVISVTYQVVN